MRKWHVALGLILGGVVWFATTGTAAQTPLGFVGLAPGEHVTLWLDRVNSPAQCEVKNVTGEFIGCAVAREGSGPARESWYNLGFVTRIDRIVKD